MSRPTYEVLQAKGELLFSAKPFGPDSYDSNIDSISIKHYALDTLELVTSRPATTRESLLAATAHIEQVRQRILDPRWLQAGRIARTSEGVYINTQGIESEAELRNYLAHAKKVNGIWLPNKGNVAFVPYETFRIGEQEAGEFVEGGLARGLEMTQDKKADTLAVIASKDNYRNGVDIWGFEHPAKEEVLHRVVGLGSVVDRLGVGGDSWSGGEAGFAFGVVDTAGDGSQKN